jgi:hypothetical protein
MDVELELPRVDESLHGGEEDVDAHTDTLLETLVPTLLHWEVQTASQRRRESACTASCMRESVGAC